MATAPYYRPLRDEQVLFEHAYRERLPVLLKGPTGCGKSRFVEAMAARLGRPLVTVACHDETSAVDLVGRYLVKGGETVWQDGPVARAVRAGALSVGDVRVIAHRGRALSMALAGLRGVRSGATIGQQRRRRP